jgi:predicted DNA-binding transcriptional regulator AlpA
MSQAPAPAAPQAAIKFIAPRAAVAITSLSRRTLQRETRRGSFPVPVRLGPQRIAYVEAEVTAWQAAQVAARLDRAA